MTSYQFIELPRQAKDITGLESGRLKVLGCIGRNKRGQLLWLCQCSCGNTHTDVASHLKAKHTKSCGCWRSDNGKARGKENISHGMTASYEYNSWKSMKVRCLNPLDKDYENYHGLNVKVCKRWINSFSDFNADMGPRPTSRHSLDRYPDNNGNYSCGKCEECIKNEWKLNCRWATSREQNRNRRNNILVTWNNVTHCLSEWEEITGIREATIQKRIKKGWSIQDAMTVPPSRKNTKSRFVKNQSALPLSLPTSDCTPWPTS